MKNLVIIGAGGFGRELCSAAHEAVGFGERFRMKGFLDANPSALGRFDGYPPIIGSPEDYADSKVEGNAKGGKVAVIFGNERTGLTDDQLDMCTLGVAIPSSQEFGSLNLSHAVQIICYHLFRQKLKNSGKTNAGFTPLTLERLDKTVSNITDNLQKIGFFKLAGRPDMERFWRSLLARAALSESEAQYIEKTFTKMAGLAGKNKD